MLNKEVILNTVLKDDSQETGGTSTPNETLKDFMEEVGVIDKPISLDLLNQHLKTCGIKELYKENYPELFSYTEEDILPNFKNNYDFLDDFSYVKHNADDEYEPDIENTFVEEIILENLFINVFPELMDLNDMSKCFSCMYNTDSDFVAVSFIDFDDEVSIIYNYMKNGRIRKNS
jgi:hypothetical protein